jgi:hypothetical protein
MPKEIIGMFHLLKGQENLEMYDHIITEIWKDLGYEETINTSVISLMKFGKFASIKNSIHMWTPKEKQPGAGLPEVTPSPEVKRATKKEETVVDDWDW